MKWAVEVGALGRGRSQGPGTGGEGAGAAGTPFSCPFGLVVSVPGGPTKAGGREEVPAEAPTCLWHSSPAGTSQIGRQILAGLGVASSNLG